MNFILSSLQTENIQDDSNPKRHRPITKLDKIIKEANENCLELVPLDNKLKMCTKEQKAKYLQDNNRSRVFKKNLELLNKALNEKKSVTFSGRNLYIVPSKEHDEIQAKDRASVIKFRNCQKTLKKLQLKNIELMKEKQYKLEKLAKIKEFL